MGTDPRNTMLVPVIACSTFVLLNVGFALFYSAIGLGIACLIVLATIWAEKKTSLSTVVKATREDPTSGTAFKFAGIIASLTLIINIVMVTSTVFNSELIVGTGSTGLILAAVAALAYVPFFIRQGRVTSAS